MTTALKHDELVAPRWPGPRVEAAETGPAWLADIRKSAHERFTALGLPTTKLEAWRFTNLKAIAGQSFVSPAADDAEVARQDLQSFEIESLKGPRLVFVNGRYRADLSHVQDMPAGMTVMTFAEAWSTQDQTLRDSLTRHASFEDDAFTALNTAAFEDGTIIKVDRGASIADAAVSLLHVTSASDAALLTHPRTLIVVSDNAEATVVEDYVTLGDNVHLTNAVTEIVIGANAHAHHYFVERESTNAFHVSTLATYQARDSRLSSHSILLGGAIVRNHVNPVLDGEGCDSLLNGLYIGREHQHMDNHMLVEHRKGRCESRQFYRGVMNDDARGVFCGRIVVSRDAQQTDAVQSSENLLLSDSAQVNTMPQLEIYADDVKCTHGATVGQLDEDALFYLRSRGMDEASAKGMMIYSLARENIDRMNLEPLRDWLTGLVLARLPYTETLSAWT